MVPPSIRKENVEKGEMHSGGEGVGPQRLTHSRWGFELYTHFEKLLRKINYR